MKDSASMVKFLATLLELYKASPQSSQDYWADHPLEFVSFIHERVCR